MIWLGPLTIVSAVMAVLATRHVALLIIPRPPRFDILSMGPSILDTAVLVTIAIFVFASVASSAAPRPRQRYRLVAFVALLVSFLPDLLLLRAAPWPPVSFQPSSVPSCYTFLPATQPALTLAHRSS